MLLILLTGAMLGREDHIDVDGTVYVSLASGDLDGDGYADLLWGDRGGGDEVQFLRGSASGLVSESTWTPPGTGYVYDYGAAMAAGFDFDGDGLHDAVVSDYNARDGDHRGAVYLVLGDVSGPSPSDASVLTSPDGEREYGKGLVDAGDVDGDGYDDLLVRDDAGWTVLSGSTGEPSSARIDWDGAVDGGHDVDGDGHADVLLWDTRDGAYLAFGSPSGVELSGAQTLMASGSGEFAFAGDTNADGFADVLFGDWSRYAAQVYTGGPGGLDLASPIRLDRHSELGNGYGKVVSAAGDVDADGYDDILVAATLYSDTETYQGMVVLFPGSETGPVNDLAEQIVASSPSFNDNLGSAMRALSDVDGDGYDDVALATSQNEGGRVLLLHGDCRLRSSWPDADGDGYGDRDQELEACRSPSDHIFVGQDCADDDPERHPDADEAVGDGVDSDCDDWEICYQDEDGDGYMATGYPRPPTVNSKDAACLPQDGEAPEGALEGDCDDQDPTVNPGATDEPIGDGVDQDCDGQERCYKDLDRDGYRNAWMWTANVDCGGPGQALAGETLPMDCDDDSVLTNPGAYDEPCDGYDHDCDGWGDAEDDEDGDGLSWAEEVELRTDACDPDTDGDGLLDGADPNPNLPQPDDGCGCTAGGGPSVALVLAALALARRRR